MHHPGQNLLFDVADHSNRGKLYEQEFETLHEWYRRQGWCDIRKVPNNWRFISWSEYQKLLDKLPGSHLARTEDGRFMQRVKSDLDFVGSGSSFGICFDAKVTSDKRGNFPIGNIEEHQFYKMRDRARCGIIAGAMVFFAAFDRVFFIPYKYLDDRRAAMERARIGGRRAKPGTASISIADCEAHAVEIFRHKMNSLWDWYPRLVNQK